MWNRNLVEIPALVAAFAMVPIAYSRSAVIVVQPARAAGADTAQAGSRMIVLAGLALLSTIANSLYTAVIEVSAREAAVITFVVTTSDLGPFGIGAAFCGLVAGGLTTLALTKK